MDKLTQNEKKKMKNDIYKLNKFQWNKIKDLIDEETTKYTIKNDGIYLRLNLLSDKLQVRIKNYIDDCILELENIDDININLNNDILNEKPIDDNTISFIQNEENEDNTLNFKKINDLDSTSLTNEDEDIELDDDEEEEEEENEEEEDEENEEEEEENDE